MESEDGGIAWNDARRGSNPGAFTHPCEPFGGPAKPQLRRSGRWQRGRATSAEGCRCGRAERIDATSCCRRRQTSGGSRGSALVAQTYPGSQACERDSQAERRCRASSPDLETPMTADDAMEHFGRRLVGVRAVQKVGEIGAVHDVLSITEGFQLPRVSITDGQSVTEAETTPSRKRRRARRQPSPRPISAADRAEQGPTSPPCRRQRQERRRPVGRRSPGL